MMRAERAESERFLAYDRRHLEGLSRRFGLPRDYARAIDVVATVLPFRVNEYVASQLIDWSALPDDPVFQLTFPQRGMLEPQDFARIDALLRGGAPEERVRRAAREIQTRLNPHPAGQLELNVPSAGGARLPGIQHKYRETVLFFPAPGQTCHAYCSYCFRWPQFVGLADLRFASREAGQLVAYLSEHPEVSSVLVTGGDPLVMRTSMLRRYLEPLLALPHLNSIRLGTKSLAYWPQRFVSDGDADELLRLFEEVVQSGKTLAVMAHYTHPRELATGVAERALRRVLATGAVVRCQAPVVNHVNADAVTWAELWRTQVRLGAVPYYMFVARDTGARRYFEVPLVQAHAIYREALARVSGLARTARGPSMSATPGKVVVDGVAEIAGERVFALRLLQGRNPDWVGRPFFARFDAAAAWLDELQPAFGAREFFFESELAELARRPSLRPWTRADARRLPVVRGASGGVDDAA